MYRASKQVGSLTMQSESDRLLRLACVTHQRVACSLDNLRLFASSTSSLARKTDDSSANAITFSPPDSRTCTKPKASSVNASRHATRERLARDFSRAPSAPKHRDNPAEASSKMVCASKRLLHRRYCLLRPLLSLIAGPFLAPPPGPPLNPPPPPAPRNPFLNPPPPPPPGAPLAGR